MPRRFVPVVCLLGLLWSSAPAHAYIDPAAGSLLLQAVIAGVAGLLLTLKLFWRRIADFFGSKSSQPQSPAASEPESETPEQ